MGLKRTDEFRADAAVMLDSLHAKGHAGGVLPARPRHVFCQCPGHPSCLMNWAALVA